MLIPSPVLFLYLYSISHSSPLHPWLSLAFFNIHLILNVHPKKDKRQSITSEYLELKQQKRRSKWALPVVLSNQRFDSKWLWGIHHMTPVNGNCRVISVWHYKYQLPVQFCLKLFCISITVRTKTVNVERIFKINQFRLLILQMKKYFYRLLLTIKWLCDFKEFDPLTLKTGLEFRKDVFMHYLHKRLRSEET